MDLYVLNKIGQIFGSDPTPEEKINLYKNFDDFIVLFFGIGIIVTVLMLPLPLIFKKISHFMSDYIKHCTKEMDEYDPNRCDDSSESEEISGLDKSLDSGNDHDSGNVSAASTKSSDSGNEPNNTSGASDNVVPNETNNNIMDTDERCIPNGLTVPSSSSVPAQPSDSDNTIVADERSGNTSDYDESSDLEDILEDLAIDKYFSLTDKNLYKNIEHKVFCHSHEASRRLQILADMAKERLYNLSVKDRLIREFGDQMIKDCNICGRKIKGLDTECPACTEVAMNPSSDSSVTSEAPSLMDASSFMDTTDEDWTSVEIPANNQQSISLQTRTFIKNESETIVPERLNISTEV